MANKKDIDKMTKRIGYLNEAAIQIRNALSKIKKAYKNDNDMDCHVWNVEKQVDKMQKFIFARLKKECLDTEFKDAIEGFDRMFRRKNNGKKNKNKGE